MALTVSGIDLKQTSLRDVLLSEMRNKSVTQSEIAAAKGINIVYLSRMLGGSRSFSIDILDAITEMLDYKAGHFYEYYTQECWEKDGNKLHKKTVEYVLRCLELGLVALVDKFTIELVNRAGNLGLVFKIAESLFGMSKHHESLSFYELIIDKEQNRFSSDLAICYYRRMLIVRERDLIQAFEAAVKLTEHLRNLKGLLQTEAYLKVLAVFFAVEHWRGLDKYSKELEEIATDVDLEAFAGAIFYQGLVAEIKEDYKQALECIKKYSTGINEMYDSLAIVNKYTVEISAGNFNRVYDLIDYINDNPARCRNLATVIKAFVINEKFDELKSILERFKNEIDLLHSFNDPLSAKYITSFRYYRATYFVSKERYSDAIEDLLYAVNLSARLKMPAVVIRCVKLMLENVSYCTKEQLENYSVALEEYEKVKKYDTICIM